MAEKDSRVKMCPNTAHERYTKFPSELNRRLSFEKILFRIVKNDRRKSHVSDGIACERVPYNTGEKLGESAVFIRSFVGIS